jgi:hypothetical protein
VEESSDDGFARLICWVVARERAGTGEIKNVRKLAYLPRDGKGNIR